MSGDRNSKNPGTDSSEDNRLKKWGTWIKEWNRVSTLITRSVERPPGHSLFAKSEGRRKILEDKLLLQYAKIPTHFDKYRGKPDFYELPTALKDESGDPKYFAVKTKEEQFIVPSIEQIGTPEMILQEKNILTDVKNFRKMWDVNEYRKQQMRRYSEKIKNIIPHRADLSQIQILGTQISIIPETDDAIECSKKNSEITIDHETDIENDHIEKPHPLEDLSPPVLKYCLKINNFYLDERMNTHSNGFIKLRLNFEYNASTGKPLANYLNLENCGCTVLRIYWEKIERPRIFRNLVEDRSSTYGFYFDKKEMLLLPDEKIEFPVWFKSTSAGHYTETWRIDTKPKIWREQIDVCLVFESFAFYQERKEKTDALLKSVDEQVKNVLIQELLNDVLYELKFKDNIKPPCVYKDDQIFELANLYKGKPQYIFDAKILNQLKVFYEKVKKISNRSMWDYSIASLKRLSQDMDVHIYLQFKKDEMLRFVARTGYSNIKLSVLTKSHTNKKKKEKGKPKKAEKKSKSSKGSKKGKKGKKEPTHEAGEIKHEVIITNEPYIYNNQTELSKIIQQLDRPTVRNLERQKYFCCRAVLCSYFTKMCHLLDDLEVDVGVNSVIKYPIYQHKIIPIEDEPDRLIYESFDQDYVPKSLTTIVSYPLEAKPKPVKLNEIEINDIEKLYTTYFNRPIPVIETKDHSDKKKKKGDKKKGGKSPKAPKKKEKKSSSKGSSKSNKSDKKKKHGKVKEHAAPKKDISIVSFDPYTESYNFVEESEDASVVSVFNSDAILSGQKVDDYKYKSYLVVHSCLSEAVDAVVDTLNMFDCLVPYDTISQVKSYFQEEVNKDKE